MSYATPEDLLDRKDNRDIGDLVSDDSERVRPAALQTNTRLQTALDDAAGDIEAALLVGGRYTPNDLAGLTGTSLEYLKRINVEIAMYFLILRRPEINLDQLEYYAKMRENFLIPLQEGKDVFNLGGDPDAPEIVESGLVQVDGPTTHTYLNLNLIRDRSLRYFPGRRNPGGR